MNATTDRRSFLKALGGGLTLGLTNPFAAGDSGAAKASRHPNVVFVFADQWRAQATGYMGDPNAKTPHLDRLAGDSVNFVNAVSTCPVCTPYRASLITGQYADRHGAFLNDVCLSDTAVSIAQAYRHGGYQTAYIGKWHLDGHGRSAYIPQERRQGFEYWKVLECTHNYNKSYYFDDSPEKKLWPGYDAACQTQDACAYIRRHTGPHPFALFLSWGPPHNPYQTAPARHRALFDPATLVLPDNVPKEKEAEARRDLAGYYAHCHALDESIGQLLKTLDETGLSRNTLFVFTSDHGDMLYSQGEIRKQKPFDESIRVPFLMRCPGAAPGSGRTITAPIGTPDIMPTLLGLCGLTPPDSAQGADWSKVVRGMAPPPAEEALIACYTPFGEWTRARGGREFRGIRTERYTYVRTLDSPWLLYDNEKDPSQKHNRIDDPAYAERALELDERLKARLKSVGDRFLKGEEYIQQWGYTVDQSGTVPYTA